MRKRKSGKAVRAVLYLIVCVGIFSLSGTLFVLITGSQVAAVIAFFCAAVLCLLPAVFCKTVAVVCRAKSLRAAIFICIVGFILSLPVSLCYYIGRDYELRVYRYMKSTAADDYYFGGYEEYLSDYSGAEDFMRQMQAAPASIVLEDMSEEKLAQLTAQELAVINGESLWDYCGFDDILGSTPEEVERSLEISAQQTAYDFTFGERGLRAKNFRYLIAHPSTASDELADMIRSPDSCCFKFSTLAVFLLTQLFAAVFVMAKFDYEPDKGIVYTVYKKRK